MLFRKFAKVEKLIESFIAGINGSFRKQDFLGFRSLLEEEMRKLSSSNEVIWDNPSKKMVRIFIHKYKSFSSSVEIQKPR
jgi:hypothetical protein